MEKDCLSVCLRLKEVFAENWVVFYTSVFMQHLYTNTESIQWQVRRVSSQQIDLKTPGCLLNSYVIASFKSSITFRIIEELQFDYKMQFY